MALILDEAWSKVDPATARAAGYSGVIGYVSQDATGKNLTRAQVDAIHAAGMDVGLVYEFNPQSAAGGMAEGIADANIAVQHARILDAPVGVCLYAAVDWDVQQPSMNAVMAYAHAFQSICATYGYRAGIYGSYNVCWALHSNGYTGLLWQTYAWSHGLWTNGLAVRQTQNGVHVAGADVDRDETMVADWGQWPAVGRPGITVLEGDVSQTTDNLVYAFMEGVDHTTTETGQAIGVEPVKWRVRDEAWQATITGALAALSASVAKLGTATGGLTADEAADLHAVAAALGKLSG